MSTQNELFSQKSIKNALKVWNNSTELGQHPLAQLDIVKQRQHKGTNSSAGDGLALRELLKEAIEELKPEQPEPTPLTKPWRPYFVITQRYINQHSQEYIQGYLVISRAVYFTEQKKGLDGLGDILSEWEQKSLSVEPVEEPRQRIFMAPPLPDYALVGRDQTLANLRRRLVVGSDLAFYALKGLPGVGKTALAITLAHDQQVREHFRDGILWAGLGRAPDLLSLLSLWGMALGIPASETAQFERIEERAQLIHAAIGTRQMLLVIDDAWQIDDALAFKLGGPSCAHILTTRQPELALDFAGGVGVELVEELNQADSLKLLSQFVPEMVIRQPEAARALVQAVDGLPLALILMGHYLHKAMILSQSATVLPDTLEQLQHVTGRLNLTMRLSPLQKPPSLPYGTPLSLLASIALSDNALNEAERQTLRALSTFPPKPNSFSKEAALAVAQQPVETLEALIKAGLLERRGEERYTLHQAIADYASLPSPLLPPDFSSPLGARRGESPARSIYYQRAAAYFANFALRHSTSDSYSALDIDWQNASHFLQWAHSTQQWQTLVDGVEGLTHVNLGIMGFMDATGHWGQAKGLLEQALEGARALNNREVEASILTKLGAFAFRQANFEAAEQYLQQSLAILARLPFSVDVTLHATHLYEFMARLEMQRDLQAARQWVERGLAELEALSVQPQSVSHQKGYFHVLLATLNGRMGDLSAAIAAGKKGLALLPESPTAARISALTTLGAVCYVQGKIDQSLEYQQQGIEVAQKIGDLRQLTKLWVNMGLNEQKRANLFAAITNYEKALQLCQSMGDIATEGSVYINLGLIYLMLGENDSASSYLETAIRFAETHGLLESEAFSNTTLAHLRIEQDRLTEATSALHRAHDICRDSASNYLLPTVLYWLAEIARLKGEHDHALALIAKSLQVASNGGYLWLEGLACSIKGKILDAMQRFDEAQEAHRRSLQLLANQELYDLAQSQLAFGKHYLMRDGHLSERANSLLGEALATFERLGAKRDIGKIRELLGD